MLIFWPGEFFLIPGLLCPGGTMIAQEISDIEGKME